MTGVTALRPRTPRRWSDEEERLLAQYLEEGTSFTAIGAALGRNPDAVRSKAIDRKLWVSSARRAPASARKASRYAAIFGD